MSNFNECKDMIQRLVDREGGYVDHPDDKGGPTNFGITRATLAEYWAVSLKEVDRDSIKRLNRSSAEYIYYELYLRQPKIAEISDDHLREHIFDCAVLHGKRRAIRWLQAFVGVGGDGYLGPITLNAVEANLAANSGSSKAINDRILIHRVKFMVAIAKRDPTQMKWLMGWVTRAFEFLI